MTKLLPLTPLYPTRNPESFTPYRAQNNAVANRSTIATVLGLLTIAALVFCRKVVPVVVGEAPTVVLPAMPPNEPEPWPEPEPEPDDPDDPVEPDDPAAVVF